jgi:branched-chain amino acid aminotransferase
MERIRKNAGMLLMTGLPPVDELVGIMTESPAGTIQTDVYLRPCFCRRDRRRPAPQDGARAGVIAVPFGNYIDTERGIRLMTSSWRRNADDAPARGKIVGGYVNMASKSEAELNSRRGPLLTNDSNASGRRRMFIVATAFSSPRRCDDILEGVTRLAVFELAKALGIRDPPISRSEVHLRRDVPVRYRGPNHRSSRSTIGRSGPQRRPDRAPDWEAY